MYFPVLKPIAEMSAKVIELAVAGDLTAARSCLDHVRVLRARLARTLDNDKLSVEQYLREKMGADGGVEEPGVPRDELDANELTFYQGQVAALNESLDTIRKWLHGSIEPFTKQELMASLEGQNLFLDFYLAEVWDFSQDIVLLWGSHQWALAAALRTRGQRFIVQLFDEAGLTEASSNTEFMPQDSPPNEEDFVTVFWNINDPPKQQEIKRLVGNDIPTLKVIDCSVSERGIQDETVTEVVKQLSTALIGLRSLKEWPILFVEQWLGQLPRMSRFRSATDCMHLFKDRDVLIASPGPSLTDCIPTLKETRNSFLVLAPVRTLSALFDAGIAPDFTVQVDATDFSEYLPDHPLLADSTLICCDHVHSSVWDAGFRDVLTMPEAHLSGGKLSGAMHNHLVARLGGGSVSVYASELALAFGARSVTLIGQDLSIGRGKYASAASKETSAEDKRLGNWGIEVTCQGIDGEELPTKPDYLWFISEFKTTADRYRDQSRLINSTSYGAYLEGWEHIPFAEHPLILNPGTQNSLAKREVITKLSDAEYRDRCSLILDAVRIEYEDATELAKFCGALKEECHSLIKSSGNNVTELERLESDFNTLFSAVGSILKFYTSRHTVALAAAVKSVESLEENLQVSAEYYHHVGKRAQKLASILRKSAHELEVALLEMGVDAYE